MKGYMSASGIKKFGDCPKQWWFRYVSDLDPEIGEPKYLDLGNAVHYTIEDVLPQVSPPYDEEELHANLRQVYEAVYYDLVTDDLKDAADTCLRVAARTVAKKQPDILGIEAEVTFNVDRPDLSSQFNAKMDVCTETEIWDWKTGSIRDDTPLKEKIQGAVYMAAYHVKYGRPPEKIRFLYLKEEQARSLDPTDEVWETMLNRAKRLALAKRNDDFPATPGDVCHWCDYQHACSAAGGVGIDFDWTKWRAL